ncbi:phosphate/phosphite/phosphonate ABC transporter substrate-binding protein [bacterium]|nr:MAG: phosphate/phosphite/phosphonate ABC transporter substrate-binding protein [bacterium]
MPNRPLVRLALLLLPLALLAGCAKSDAPRYKIGFMICNSVEETKDRFAGLIGYLNQTTGYEFDPVYLDTQDFEEAFARGDFDFTHTNSLVFAALSHRQGLKLVASEKRGSYGAKSCGTIIVRKDSPIKTLEDLKDKRIIFGPQWAPFGFLAQYALLIEKGYDPEKHLGPYFFPQGTWKHEKIIYSVLYGAYDAGAAPIIDLEEMTAEGKISPDDFRVIAKSGLAPYCTFGASKKMPDEAVAKVREALLKITPQTTGEAAGERVAVLKRARVDGFEELPAGEYDILLKWAKMAKMPPFEE